MVSCVMWEFVLVGAMVAGLVIVTTMMLMMGILLIIKIITRSRAMIMIIIALKNFENKGVIMLEIKIM